MPRVGICRALDGFRFLPQWQAFLSELNCPVIVSEPTNRRILESGVRLAPAELCLPVKACVGHALALGPRVDFLLVPRIVCRTEGRGRLFGCPKTIALPDMLRALVPDLPPVAELRIDDREHSENQAYLELAATLGCNRADARRALRRTAPSITTRPRTVNRTMPDGCRPGTTQEDGIRSPGQDRTRPVVAVIGHDYLVEDEELSLGLLKRLEATGAALAYGRPDEDCCNTDRLRPGFEPDWLFERELVRQALGWAARPDVDGLLLASSFACGTSAVSNEIIRHAVRRQRPGLAVLELMFDEQTGPAGLTTRLESFVELLRMRR